MLPFFSPSSQDAEEKAEEPIEDEEKEENEESAKEQDKETPNRMFDDSGKIIGSLVVLIVGFYPMSISVFNFIFPLLFSFIR